MTSRKNQQAARQYMQTHDVSYMEARRRVTSGNSPAEALPAATLFPPTVSARPLSDPLTLGYRPPTEPEPVKPSLLDRLRGHSPQPQVGPVTPYEIGEDNNYPSLVTVYGPPGFGKTTLLRSLLEQYRGYAAYVVHGGDMVQGTSWNGDMGVEPWEGLVETNLRPWDMTPVNDADEMPHPPSISDLPNGALVVLDLGGIRGNLSDSPRSFYNDQVRSKLGEWFEFEALLGHMARSKIITVVTSVATDDSIEAMTTPLGDFQSPLGGSGALVRAGAMPFGVGVFEVLGSMTRRSGYITLTEEEAAQRRLSRSFVDEKMTSA